MRNVLNPNYYWKVFVCFLIAFIIGITPLAAIAKEGPPGPGLWEILFGGAIHYFVPGVTIDMWYKMPEWADKKQEWHKYNFDPNRSVMLLPGTLTSWDINIENGRKKDDNVESTIEWSNPVTNTRDEVCKFKGSYCRFQYRIPEKNIMTNFMRVYVDPGRRDQDGVAAVVLAVDPNVEIRKEVTYQRSDVSEPVLQEQPQTQTLDEPKIECQNGTVKVNLYDSIEDMKSNNPSAKSLDVVFYTESVRSPATGFTTIRGMRDFKGFPAGKFRIYFGQSTVKWFIMDDMPRREKDSKNALIFELKPSSEITINLIRIK